MSSSNETGHSRGVYIAVLVAALGYFVDIYDLILFSIVRSDSLRGLGITGEALTSDGIFLLNTQMFGLLVGGILWGVLGDRKGRLTVLFGSIFLYSAANLANGFVQDVNTYALLRFIAGVGLAGELGAGITLVSEIMSKEKRGYGTTFIATLGLLGAVAASQVAGHDWGYGADNWRVAYFVGGGLGLLLLLLRVRVYESGMYAHMRDRGISRGNFLKLFTTQATLFKFVQCIAIGLPIWYVVGILITFSPELSTQIGIVGSIKAREAVLWTYVGLSVGDICCGLLSQWLRSRRQAVLAFLLLSMVLTAYYLTMHNVSPTHFYLVCFGLGFGGGFWAIFVTIASEQFGTNIRATVTTTVPNFVRGAVTPMTLGFGWLSTGGSYISAAWVVGGITFLLALVALWRMEDTFGKDLNYYEEL